MKKKQDGSSLVTVSLLDIKLEEQDRRNDDKAKLYRDQILTKLDGVMGELEAIREDNTLGAGQTRELRMDVDDLKKRVKKLEQS